MSNQNFKMILTGPISAMGDVVNCVTGHGGKIEMVEVEQSAPVETKRAAPKADDASIRINGLQVYRALMNGDITVKTTPAIARYLAATLGGNVSTKQVGSHLWRMQKVGIIKVVANAGTRSQVYGIANSGISPAEAMRRLNDWQRKQYKRG